MPTNQDIIQSLFSSAQVNPETGCWEWQGSRNDAGYGRMQFCGRSQLVHRVVAHLALEMPLGSKGICALHHCDNPPCFNPDHLFIGSQQDNVDDCAAKGRARKAIGEESGTSKLTGAEVLDIRSRYVAGEPYGQIASVFAVSVPLVALICQKKLWRHVGGEQKPPYRKPPHEPRSISVNGIAHPLATLTESDVVLMRDIYADGRTSQRALADLFGVTQPRVQMILARRAWTHI